MIQTKPKHSYLKTEENKALAVRIASKYLQLVSNDSGLFY